MISGGAPSEDKANSVAVDPPAPRDTASKPPVVSSSASGRSDAQESSRPSAATDRGSEAPTAEDPVSEPIVPFKFPLPEGHFIGADGKYKMRIPGRGGYRVPKPRLRRAPFKNARRLYIGGVDLSMPIPYWMYPEPCLRKKTAVPKPQNKGYPAIYLSGAGVIAAILIGVVASVIAGKFRDPTPKYEITAEKVQRAFKAAVDGANFRKEEEYMYTDVSQEAQVYIKVLPTLHPSTVEVDGEIEFKILAGSEYIVKATLKMPDVRLTARFGENSFSCSVSEVTIPTISRLSPHDDVRINLETIEVEEPIFGDCKDFKQMLDDDREALEEIMVSYVIAYIERDLQPLLMEQLSEEVVTEVR